MVPRVEQGVGVPAGADGQLTLDVSTYRPGSETNPVAVKSAAWPPR